MAHVGTGLLAGDRYAELIDAIGVGVMVRSRTGAVRGISSTGAKLLGVDVTDLVNGRRPDGWQVTDDNGTPLPEIATPAAQVLAARTAANTPLVIHTAGGSARRLWAESYPVTLRGERLVLTIIRPVWTDMLRARGLVDPLTGLPDRLLFADRLGQALVRARVHGTVVSVVLAAIQGDDATIQAAAARLRAGLRADHTVARYSGGTVAVLADHPCGTGASVACRVADLAAGTGVLVRTGWITGDGTETVHEMIDGAQTRLRNSL